MPADFVANGSDPQTGAGFYDFASTTVETVGETLQTGVETIWGGLFQTAQTGIETAGETVQTFPESARDVGVAGAEAAGEALPGAAGRAAFGGTVGLAVGAAILGLGALAYTRLR
jgi:hypothetical protein